jgi:transposase-like protein
MSAADIRILFHRLPHPQQLALLRELKEAISQGALPPDRAGLFKQIRESRVRDGHVCPHCGSKTVVKNGRYGLRQRYWCKECDKTFNDLTNSPLGGVRKLDQMLDYFKLMVENQGITLQACAQKLNISITTAFFWRHKILSALRANHFESLGGIVEGDETTFLESDKGSRQITRRKPRKRGGKAKKRGLSTEQVAVAVVVDRSGRVATMVAGKGQATAQQLGAALYGLVDPSAKLCTDAAGNFEAYARRNGLKHFALNASKEERVRDIYHIQNANNFQRRLKLWIERFYGVATKYMNNYLYWFFMLDKHKKVKAAQQNEQFLYASNLSPTPVQARRFRPCLAA